MGHWHRRRPERLFSLSSPVYPSLTFLPRVYYFSDAVASGIVLETVEKQMLDVSLAAFSNTS